MSIHFLLFILTEHRYTFENLKCTRKFILNRLDSIIKTPRINGRYLSILVKMHTKDNDTVYLGSNFFVDRLNLNSVKLCKFYFNLKYNEIVIDNEIEISSLILSFEEVKRDEYVNHMDEFYKDSNQEL